MRGWRTIILNLLNHLDEFARRQSWFMLRQSRICWFALHQKINMQRSRWILMFQAWTVTRGSRLIRIETTWVEIDGNIACNTNVAMCAYDISGSRWYTVVRKRATVRWTRTLRLRSGKPRACAFATNSLTFSAILPRKSRNKPSFAAHGKVSFHASQLAWPSSQLSSCQGHETLYEWGSFFAELEQRAYNICGIELL